MLSLLASEYFENSPLLVLPIVALVIFMAVFTSVTVRALRQDRREIERLARLPLADDE